MLRNSIWLKNIEEVQINGFKIKINVTAGQDFKMTFQNIASAVVVSWGDGSAPQNVSANGQVSKTYSSGGEKIVTISGRFGVKFDNASNGAGNAAKVTDVMTWGNGDGVKFTNCSEMFRDCSNLRATLTATDTPDLSLCTDMSRMFQGCSLFNTNINNWNVSTIQDMRYVFSGTSAFNQPLNNWDMRDVRIIDFMFSFFSAFNQDISNWDVSNVTSMYGLFAINKVFNQPLNAWGNKTRNVIIMAQVFYQASAFNRPLNDWDVSKVENMSEMFYEASAFNQPLDKWNVSNVTDMLAMFQSVSPPGNFNQDLSMWCVTKIPTKPNNFDRNVTNWTLPRPCWGNCPADFGDGFKFVVNNVGGSFNMTFQNLVGIARINWGDPCGFQTVGGNGLVTHPYSGNGPYTITIAGTFGVKFDNASNGGGNAAKVTDVVSWGRAGGTKFTNCENMFNGCNQLRATLTATDTPDLSLCSTTSYMFSGCTQFNHPIGNWDVSSINNMSYMFGGTLSTTGASAFNQDLGAWNVSNVTAMQFMFANAFLFNNGGSGSINNWRVDNVTNMDRMFGRNANGIVPQNAFNQNIGSWKTGKVTNMTNMFSNSRFNNGGSPTINDWDTSEVTTMSRMFSETYEFNQPIGNWNTGKVQSMSFMFGNSLNRPSIFNQYIGDWDVSRVGSANPGNPSSAVGNMISSCVAFNQDLSRWCVTNIPSLDPGTDFDSDTPAWTLPRPVWGTCPP
jgi:surface protein